MHISGEIIFIVLLVGIIVGLIPSTVAQRTGFQFVRDLTIGVISACIGAWLTLSWRDLVSATVNLPSSKPSGSSSISADSAPNYEAAVFPLAPLHTLLKPIIPRSREEICNALSKAARRNDLPTPYFIRLLYQESNFKPGAMSSAGALDIAQFMPETAADRGLDNPFDPLQAIPASARLLRDLYQRFGNLGLAAAAYNAGPRRVADWLASKSQLPQETQEYVKTITGWPAERWTVAQVGSPAVKLPQDAPCQEVAGLLAWNGPVQIPLPPRNPRVKNLSHHVTVAPRSELRTQSTKSLHKKKEVAEREQEAAAIDLPGIQSSEKLARTPKFR
jgi:uncharacterized membrane protein YeaQ/YmgE (transglycosylase-associated protein family)